MNWKKIIAIVIGVALIAAFILKLKSNKEIVTERVYQYDNQEKIPVELKVLNLEDLGDEQSFSGSFQPFKESKLSAETQGKVNYISVDLGDYVHKGQTLIQLDKSLLELQVKSLDVKIEELQADKDRYTILTQADAIQGVKLEKVSVGLKTLYVQKASLEEQINKSRIKAPFSGFITAKFTEIGAFAAPGMPLLQLTNINQLKFTVNISEHDLSQFKMGTTHTILADVYPDAPLIGTTTMIASKANMGGAYPVQFTVNNFEDHKIKSGMFGRVLIDNSQNTMGFLLPSSAIVGGSTQTQVYMIEKGKAVLKNITLSQRIKDKTVISDGVTEGDTIVVTGLINLYDGANVSFN